MSDLRTAAQQALEALEAFLSDELRPHEAAKISAALRAALAQQAEPVQEPVAWMCSSPELMAKGYKQFSSRCEGDWNIPVYLSPPRCPNCSSLEAQNTELDRKLAELDQDETAQEPEGLDWRYTARIGYVVKPYTAPSQRKPLTEEEILKAIGWERAEMYMKLTPNFPVDEAKQETLKNARAVERAAWEKNHGQA